MTKWDLMSMKCGSNGKTGKVNLWSPNIANFSLGSGLALGSWQSEPQSELLKNYSAFVIVSPSLILFSTSNFTYLGYGCGKQSH